MATDEQVGAPVRDSLIVRIRRSWARDSHLSMKRRLQKGVQMVSQLLRARVALRHCDRVGANARVAGRMRVVNRGSITLGGHLNVNSSWVPTELLTGESGHIAIGDDVLINFGVVIAAGHSVSIGSGSMIGPHCIISDVDSPEALARSGPDVARPIEIGRDVWLAGRVTVRPGVRIGDGAVVVAGSIVEADVPPNVMASGIPARLLPKLGAGSRAAGATSAQAVQDPRSAAAGDVVPRLSGVVISEGPLDELVAALRREGATPALDAAATPSGEHAAAMSAAPPAGAADFVVIWVDAVAALPSYARLLDGADVADADLEHDAGEFCGLIAIAATRYRHVFVPTWSARRRGSGAAPGDFHAGGTRRAVMLLNWTLVACLGALKNVHVLDVSDWEAVPSSSAAPHAWYLAGTAVPPAVQERAAVAIRHAVATSCGQRRSLVILVAHETLWFARAGGPMASPERRAAYADFQHGLVGLRARGVRLAVVGTGDGAGVRAAFTDHPDLVLTASDIDAWCVGDQDIVEQVSTVARELGLSPRDAVVIDTRAAVRGHLAESLPAINLPEWPDDVLLYPTALADVAGLAPRGACADQGVTA